MAWLENPLAERGQQAGVLRDGNEIRGRHIAMQRMAPTQQCLQADDLAGMAGDDRLIVQAQHVRLHRGPQVQFNGAAALDLLGHLVGEQHRAIAAAVLGLV